ncbi:MAG: hypothetical protein O3A01_02080 [bacterium]|nr:hypothetical protein [bacterium]
MDIRPNKSSMGNSYANKDVNGAANVILGMGGQQVQIELAQIREICQRFAEIAYSMGETNDIEEYADEMSESIYKAYKKVSKKQGNKGARG